MEGGAAEDPAGGKPPEDLHQQHGARRQRAAHRRTEMMDWIIMAFRMPEGEGKG
jgi:hypothetical protein